MARSKAKASSTPGSVSMMTRKGPGSGLRSDLFSAAWVSPAWVSSAWVLAPWPGAAARGRPLIAKPAAEAVTNSRRVMLDGFFMDLSGAEFYGSPPYRMSCHKALHSMFVGGVASQRFSPKCSEEPSGGLRGVTAEDRISDQ